MKTNKLIFNNKIQIYSIEKIILYLAIIFCFEQSLLLKIDLGIFALNPYRIILILLWLSFLIYILFNKGKLDISDIRIKKYMLFLVLWLLYAMFSFVWIASIKDAIKAIIFLFVGVSIVFFEVFYFKNLRDLKRLYNIFLFLLLIMVVLGFDNCIRGRYLLEIWDSYKYARVEFPPVGVFADPNEYASYISITIPFLLVFIRYSGNIIKKILGIVLFIGILFLLVKTLSRANYLAIIFVMGFWFFFLMKPKIKFKYIISVVLFILILNMIFSAYLQDRVAIITEQLKTINYKQLSISVRANLIRNSFFIFIKTLGFGVGAGNAEYYMKNYSRYYAHGIPYIHNWLIELLLEYGILVFIGYLIFYLTLFFNLYKLYFTLTIVTEKMICEALILGLVSFPFIIFDQCPYISLKIWWIYLGFYLSFLNYYRLNYKQRVV